MGSFGKDFVVEAENHREAARQFFAQHPQIGRYRITVETKGFLNYSVEQFDATEFMDEQTRQSIPDAPKPEQRIVTLPQTYPAIRTLAAVYRVIAWLFLIVGVIFCIVVATTTSMALSFGSALFVALAFLVQLASAELLAILPDIADSTKQSAQLLRELRDQSKREV